MYQESEARELAELQLESELPIEELLRSLPSEVLSQPAPLDASDSDAADDATSDAAEVRSKVSWLSVSMAL